MTPSVLIVVGAIAAKIASVLWLVSIGTSPTSVGTRRRFLEHTIEALDNLVELGQGPEEARTTDLRQKIALLETHVREGWTEPHLFAAVLDVSAWKVGAHAYGAVAGGLTLAENCVGGAVNWR